VKRNVNLHLIILISSVFLIFCNCKKEDKPLSSVTEVIDFDGNVYPTVTIGSQIWMAENLKVSKFNDGSNIPFITDPIEWNNLTTPAYCWYNNDSINNKNTYGGLYNWHAVNTGKLAPKGWHVPTHEEWQILEDYLIKNGFNFDGTTTGNKIGKSLASDNGWTFSSFPGVIGNTDYPSYRNKSGFTALPGGYRFFDGGFGLLEEGGLWWTATLSNEVFAYGRTISYQGVNLSSGTCNKSQGFSVRCIMD
jgi:uncharacterized protein (TIGR02145 family)